MLFVCYVFGDKYDFGANSLDFSTSGFRVRKETFHRVRFSCQMKISENRYTGALSDGEPC